MSWTRLTLSIFCDDAISSAAFDLAIISVCCVLIMLTKPTLSILGYDFSFSANMFIAFPYVQLVTNEVVGACNTLSIFCYFLSFPTFRDDARSKLLGNVSFAEFGARKTFTEFGDEL